jgi:hypothetical protein
MSGVEYDLRAPVLNGRIGGEGGNIRTDWEGTFVFPLPRILVLSLSHL